MNTTPTNPPRRPLRALDFILRLAVVGLVVVTSLAVPLLAIAASGRGDVTVASRLDGPYRVEFDDGTAIAVEGGRAVTYENFPVGRERDTVAGEVSLRAMVEVPRDNRSARAVLIAVWLGWLAASWLGLLSLRAVVRSAIDAEPFADANPGRLRRLGAAIIAVPVIDVAGHWLLDGLLDPGLAFVPELGGPTPNLVLLVVGIGVMALAEPFAEAARLRRFEQETI